MRVLRVGGGDGVPDTSNPGDPQRYRVSFFVQAFNALNRVQFGSPNTSVTSSSFGVVTSQANTPRQLQFGVKLLW